MSEGIRTYPDVVRALAREALRSFNTDQAGVAEVGGWQTVLQVLRYGQERGEVRTDIPLPHLARYLGILQASLGFCLLESGAAAGSAEDTADSPTHGAANSSAQEIDRLMAFIEGGLAPQAQPQGEPV